jgi:hypothetical protein
MLQVHGDLWLESVAAMAGRPREVQKEAHNCQKMLSPKLELVHKIPPKRENISLGTTTVQAEQ